MSIKKPTLMPKAERAEAALQSAMKLAKKVGARRVSMAMVAAAQKVTAPLLFGIFKSRDGLTKAILRQAKKEGVTLPEPKPTIREAREAARKGKKPAVKKLAALKKPVKKAAPVKQLSMKPAAVKKRVRSIKEVKAIKNKLAAKAVSGTVKAKKGEDLRKLSTPELVARATRRPLTPAQKTAKAERDRARRAPTTAAEKFEALPTPFAAAIQQVAA